MMQRNWDNITSVKQHNPVRCVAQRMPKKAEGAISLFFPTDIQYPSRNSSSSMAVNKAVKRLNMTATLRKEKQHMKVKQWVPYKPVWVSTGSCMYEVWEKQTLKDHSKVRWYES